MQVFVFFCLAPFFWRKDFAVPPGRYECRCHLLLVGGGALLVQARPHPRPSCLSGARRAQVQLCLGAPRKRKPREVRRGGGGLVTGPASPGREHLPQVSTHPSPLTRGRSGEGSLVGAGPCPRELPLIQWGLCGEGWQAQALLISSDKFKVGPVVGVPVRPSLGALHTPWALYSFVGSSPQASRHLLLSLWRPAGACLCTPGPGPLSRLQRSLLGSKTPHLPDSRSRHPVPRSKAR